MEPCPVPLPVPANPPPADDRTRDAASVDDEVLADDLLDCEVVPRNVNHFRPMRLAQVQVVDPRRAAQALFAGEACLRQAAFASDLERKVRQADVALPANREFRL